MEDTKSLLMMVLHKIFQNQPKTIENTFQLIHSFNNGKIEQKFYEKTLKTICDLMNDELPSPILVYILTLVDMPQDFESNSPIMEKMRRTHDFLPEINVRPHLLEYLNNVKPFRRSETSSKKESCDAGSSEIKSSKNQFIKPKATRRSRKLIPKTPEQPKPLLDICALYIVNHEQGLKEMYKKKKEAVWTLINRDSITGTQRERCYAMVKDVNRKAKLLREIENDSISTEILMEEWKHSEDIFLKEKHAYYEVHRDPFALSEECQQLIANL